MSTYAVFGMTASAAREIAKRELLNKGLPHHDYDVRLKVKTEKIMQSDQVIMLSEKFDAPQFAKDFLELAKQGEHRHLHIKAYTQLSRDPVTGRKKMHWISV